MISWNEKEHRAFVASVRLFGIQLLADNNKQMSDRSYFIECHPVKSK